MDEDGPAGADDPRRGLAVATRDGAPHLAVVGDTYTVLVAGADSAGRHAIIDMHVPPGGGPPPHRHAFEESFVVLEGEIEVRLRDDPPARAAAGTTVNVPGGAPHAFKNVGDVPARLLCVVAPAGLEELFAATGERVATWDAPSPPAAANPDEARERRVAEIARRIGVEMLPPDALGQRA